MGNVNKVFLMGNMTRDPELRFIPSGAPVCEFGIATNRQFKTSDGEQKEEVCFVDITFWGRRGEVIKEYFKKGDPIFIEGRLKLDQWETSDGKRSKMTVVGEDFQFVSGRGGGKGGSSSGYESRGDGAARSRRDSGGGSQPPKQNPEDIGEDVSDDEIPF